MKKLFKFTPLILLLIFSISCTEEISDDLKNSDASLSETSIAEKKVGKKMSLSHLMDENLSYYLHSTKGKDYPCELEADADNFQASEYGKADYDNGDVIDCILEVEELDLQFYGVEYELSVDEFLCEYIAYQPYGFYFAPTGESDRKVFNVECDASCSDASDASTLCDSQVGKYAEYNKDIYTYGSADSLSITDIFGDYKHSEDATTDSYCKYNYEFTDFSGSDQVIACDEGGFQIRNFKIYGDEGFCHRPGDPTYDGGSYCDGDPNITTEALCTGANTWIGVGYCEDSNGEPTADSTKDNCELTAGNTWTEVPYSQCSTEETCSGAYSANGCYGQWTAPSCSIADGTANIVETDPDDYEDCGGKHYNCIAGAVTEPDHVSFPERLATVFENTDLNSFKKSWSISELMSRQPGTNIQIANYSKIFSNTSDSTTLSAPFVSNFIGNEIETYVPVPNNDAATLQGFTVHRVDQNNDGRIDYYPYNYTPFYSAAGRSISPYYSFMCLDKAYNPKAQIRLFIREWDREFDTDSGTLDNLSDCDDPAVAGGCNDETNNIMDNQGYQDGDWPWNNVGDWDNFYNFYDGSSNYVSLFEDNNVKKLNIRPNDGACYVANAYVKANCVSPNIWVSSKNSCYQSVDGDGADPSTTAYDIDALTTRKYDCEDQGATYKWMYINNCGSDFCPNLWYNFPVSTYGYLKDWY